MIGRAAIDALLVSAYLINVARGPVLETDALLDPLRAGRLAGAALDDFDHEPLAPTSQLWRVRNLTVSPHMDGDVVGWDMEAIGLFVAAIRDVLSGPRPPNNVDLVRGY